MRSFVDKTPSRRLRGAPLAGATLAWPAGAIAAALLAAGGWLWWERWPAIIVDLVAMWCG